MSERIDTIRSRTADHDRPALVDCRRGIGKSKHREIRVLRGGSRYGSVSSHVTWLSEGRLGMIVEW